MNLIKYMIWIHNIEIRINESLFQPFGPEIDFSLYIIIYISFSLLIHLVVGGSLISFPLIYYCIPEL